MKIHAQAEVTQINCKLNFGVTSSWIFFRAGSLPSRYYGMLHIAPDIGDSVCLGVNTWYRGMHMYVYEFVVFDIMVYIQVLYFDVRIWISWLRYRTLHRRKNFDIGGQRASDWSLLRISYPISKFLTLISKSWPWISKSWLRYRMWQRASDWNLLPISYPISKFISSISKSWLRYRGLWVPYIVKSSKNDFDT